MTEEEARAAIAAVPGILSRMHGFADLDEFVRRNFVAAEAEQALDELRGLVARVQHMKRKPAGVLDALFRIERLLARSPAELIAWRDQAGEVSP